MTLVEKVVARVAEVQSRLAKCGYPSFPINSKVTKELKPGIAGQARYYGNEILINEFYMIEHEASVLHDTVAHEVCHLYQHKYIGHAKQAHGPEFRGLMNLLGLAGKTHHNMKLVNGPTKRHRTVTRYIYTDAARVIECGLTPKQHERALKGASFSCKGKKVFFTGIVKKF